MTDTPALPHGPLTAEMVPLLKAGSSVLRLDGQLCVFVSGRPRGLRVLLKGQTSRVVRFGRFTYIGELGPNRWITAPEGGWTENPVPGQKVFWRLDGGERPQDAFEARSSDALAWGQVGGGYDIIAFRLPDQFQAPVPCFECGSTERIGTACKPCNPELVEDQGSFRAPRSIPSGGVADPIGPESYSTEGKFFVALDHLTRMTWRWGESCGIDDVSWDDVGDSYNEACRGDHRKARRAVVEAFHVAVTAAVERASASPSVGIRAPNEPNQGEPLPTTPEGGEVQLSDGAGQLAGLIERLRKVESGVECGPGRPDFGGATNWHRNPDGPEAADALTALQAEATKWRDAFTVAGEEAGDLIQELRAERLALQERNRELEGDVADLKLSVVAFAAPWAAEYGRMHFGPDHMHPDHYDLLARCGARMDDFIRASIDQSQALGAKHD